MGLRDMGFGPRWSACGWQLLRTTASCLPSTGSTGPDDKLIRVWSVGNGRLLRRLVSHAAPVLCLAVSADERLLLSGSHDKTIKCAAYAVCCSARAGAAAEQQSAQHAADTCRVWSVKDGSLLQTLTHRGSVYSLALSPTSDRLYSCGSDNTIQVHSCMPGVHTTSQSATCETNPKRVYESAHVTYQPRSRASTRAKKNCCTGAMAGC